jgi:hypothetical protein
MIIILIIIIIICLTYPTTEHFFPSDCDSLQSKNGLVCSVAAKDFRKDKCYRIWKSPKNPQGLVLEVVADECTLYPECKGIGINCKVPKIAQLG